MWQILGINDEQTFCDCCGRQDLKRTVILDNEGEIRRVGVICAEKLTQTARKQIKEVAEKRETEKLDLIQDIERKFRTRVRESLVEANQIFNHAFLGKMEGCVLTDGKRWVRVLIDEGFSQSEDAFRLKLYSLGFFAVKFQSGNWVKL